MRAQLAQSVDAQPSMDRSRGQIIHPSVEVLVSYLEYYGFDYFLNHTLSRIDMNNRKSASAVDEAVFDNHAAYADAGRFSINKTFQIIVAEMMEEDGLSYQEALEFLAEDDYVIPVTTAMYYSVSAGNTDIERLSSLIRNRAARLLESMGDDDPD